jgi:hypothetical protein
MNVMARARLIGRRNTGNNVVMADVTRNLVDVDFERPFISRQTPP